MLLLPRVLKPVRLGLETTARGRALTAAAAAPPVVWLLLPRRPSIAARNFRESARSSSRRNVWRTASYLMPGVGAVGASAPLVALASRLGTTDFITRLMFSRVVLVGRGSVAADLTRSGMSGATSSIWQAARAIGDAVADCHMLAPAASGRVQQPEQRAVLFASAAIVSWVALNQFPFAAPIYFCYVTPLRGYRGIAALPVLPPFRSRRSLLGESMLLLFGVLSMNRGFIQGVSDSFTRRACSMPI